MKLPVKKNEIIGLNIPTGVADKCDVEFVFTRLNIQSWHEIRMLVNRRATVFTYNPTRTAAYAAFKITPYNWQKVRDLCLRVYDWKTVFVRVHGSEAETMTEVSPWLICWISAHEDPKKHCAVRDYNPAYYTVPLLGLEHMLFPSRFKDSRITIPCRLVQWNPDITHPETYRQEYEKAAKMSGCDRCPFFNMQNFRTRITADGTANPEIEDKTE